MNKKILVQGFLHAFGVALYVTGISFVLTNGEKWFGPVKSIFGPALILGLLCLSAAIVGALIFAKPAMLVLDGKKTEGLKMFLATLSWLAIFIIIVFIAIILFR